MIEKWSQEPTRRELAAIEAEMPLIEAEMSVVDAEAVIARTDQRVSPFAERRLRRAKQQVLREMREFYGVGISPLDGVA